MRDQECFHPLCDEPAEFCQIDHVEPWSVGPSTHETQSWRRHGPGRRSAAAPSDAVEDGIAFSSFMLDDAAGWGALLVEALRESAGPLTDEERAWADEMLGTPPRRRGSAV